MNNKLLILSIPLWFFACKDNSVPETKGTWHYTKSFSLTNVFPISITGDDAHLYISSSLKTEIHKFNYDGGLVLQIKNIRKPKYLNIMSAGAVVVAESDAHVASRVEGQDYINTIPTNEFLETPYGVSVEANNIAITDLSKKKVYYNNSGKVTMISEYVDSPTDVQIKNGKIYVVDTKVNSVQVYDTTARYKFSIGKQQSLKRIGGVYVSNEEVYATDYDGNAVYVYDLKGKLKQTLNEHFENPSDVFVRGREMFVVNYASNDVAVYSKW